MSTQKRWCLLIALYLSTQFSFGQTAGTAAYPIDLNWNTTTYKFDDEFTGTSLNTTTNWRTSDYPCCGICSDNSNELSIVSNTATGYTDGSALDIGAVVGTSTVCPGASIQTGTVSSIPQWTYGYYEANILTTHSQTVQYFDQAFWLYQGMPWGCPPAASWPNASQSTEYTDEIDIAEIESNTSNSTQAATWNVHTSVVGTCNTPTSYTTVDCSNNPVTIDCPFDDLYTYSCFLPGQAPLTTASSQYHKYGVEWTPDHLIFYIDDVPVQMEHQNAIDGVPANPMSIILNIGPQLAPCASMSPANMYVDYVRVYNFTNSGAGCAANAYTTSGVPINPNAFNQIYSSITIGSNSGNSTVLSSTSKVCMRASGGTTINGPFTVPIPAPPSAGQPVEGPVISNMGMFAIIPTTCY